MSSLLGNYGRLPVTFVRGEGSRLHDDAGREYLDLLAGIAVCSLGHAHPALTEALRRQAGELLHVSNYFTTPSGEQAAAAICDRIGRGGRVFFCNSGAEANEAAIKLARKRAWRAGQPERIEIVAIEGSFHGRTLGALAATMQPAKWEGFRPLPEGYVSVPRDDAGALDAAISERTAAVILEPILGEGGVWPLDDGFVRAARELCTERDALLIVDEVQTGVGRTGSWWGYQHAQIAPDVVTLAKGLGGGVPVGAMWVDDAYADALRPGDHATTFGGNPFACTAVGTVLHTVDADGLVDNAARVGKLLADAIAPLGEHVRGRGLLLALELGRPVAADVVRAGLELGVVLNEITPTAIRLAPPLILTENEAAEGAAKLADAIAAAGG